MYCLVTAATGALNLLQQLGIFDALRGFLADVGQPGMQGNLQQHGFVADGVESIGFQLGIVGIEDDLRACRIVVDQLQQLTQPLGILIAVEAFTDTNPSLFTDLRIIRLAQHGQQGMGVGQAANGLQANLTAAVAQGQLAQNTGLFRVVRTQFANGRHTYVRIGMTPLGLEQVCKHQSPLPEESPDIIYRQ